MTKAKPLFLTLIVSIAWASHSSAQDACPTPTSPKEILGCAIKNHPKSKRSEASFSQSIEQASVAGQWLNPELGSRAVMGSSLGDRIVEAEVSLSQTIELGGKRGARIDRANAEASMSQGAAKQAREEVTLSTISDLYRLRQIVAELRIVDEALHTFGTIRKQFRSRPRLSPDQQVAFDIFVLAEGDYKYRQISLATEKASRLKALELATGSKLVLSDTILPKEKAEWPALTGADSSEFKDAATDIALSDLAVSQAEYELAKATSWPDLKIGPIVQFTYQGGISYTSLGVGVSLPFPIFSLNGGGRAYALKGVLKSENNRSLVRAEKQAELDVLRDTYRNSVEGLRESVSIAEIEKKHRNIESLFSKGLVGAPSVIEAHRQILDFTKGKHEHELQAIEALVKMNILTGKQPEEVL